MARHHRMPTQEAGYTYAVVPALPNTACLQPRGSPYTVIEKCQYNDSLDRFLEKSRLQSKDDLAQSHNRHEKDAEYLVESFSL